MRAAVRLFSLVSISGLIAVLIGGILGGTAQYIWWTVAIALDILAASVGGSAEGWNLHAEHFSERHGLFVIIARGESLIVAAISLSGTDEWPAYKVGAAILSVAIAGAMWWSYFVRNKIELDEALEESRGNQRSMLARDAYSIIHFPMVLGIIAFAATVEHALTHPSEPLGTPNRALLAASVILYAGSMELALRRARKPVHLARRLLPILTAIAVFALANAAAVFSLSVVLVGLTLLALGEPVRPRHHAKARDASAAA
jgi:low temperature requirement protein LtrA